jgi:RNA polymerase sigma-70 factor (ECF subfamily)
MLNLSRLSSEDSDYLTLSEVAQQGGTPVCGGRECAANTSAAPRAEESAAEQQRKSRQTAVVDSIDDRWNRLMAAAQRGDDAAYERLMREVRVWLSRYFHGRLPADAADDATQEALLAIHVHKQSYQTSDPMRPWLKTIARFKWIDQLRSHVRSPDSLDDADVPVDDHGSAARSAVLLDMLLAETKPAQELVIRLVKLRGESVDEASRISGQSPSLVKVNIHRGLKRIGRALDSGED